MASTWPNPAGAYRNASWTGGGSTAAQIVLDTIDSSSYPYTTLSSGAIIINRPGQVVLNAQATFSFGITIQIRVNGTTVATGNNAATSTASYTYPAKTGDSLTLWETDGLGGNSGGTGSTTTFLHVTPAGTRTPPYNASVAVNRATLY